MAEYIERDKAYTLAKKVCNAVDSNPRVLLPHIILDLIDELPTADVRPVVRGKWKVYNNTYVCFACGRPVSFWQSNFCPNCGADMGNADD